MLFKKKRKKTKRILTKKTKFGLNYLADAPFKAMSKGFGKTGDTSKGINGE